MPPKHILVGGLAAVALLSFYLGVMSLDGGLNLALRELGREWWLIGGIVLAFGTQVALLSLIRSAARARPAPGVNAAGAVTTTTSAGSMLACCLHHATEVLPLLGLTALSALVGQYRAWFFGLAYLSSAIGIAVMLRALKHRRAALANQNAAAACH